MPTDELPHQLERLVTDHATPFARRHVGLAVGAVSRSTTVSAGFGHTRMGGRVPDGGTIFQIGSITKVFAALLLADAVDRGEVTFHQPLASLIPGVAVHRSGRQITLVDLATHTSGLPRLPPGLRSQALRHRNDPYAAFTTSQLVAALRRAPKRAPGGRVRYSNFGAGVLGEALSRATGLPFEELIRERIAAPLGLDDTADTWRDRRHRCATGHSRRRRPVPDWRLPAMPAAGALWSTVDDLLVFVAAHLDPPASRLSGPVEQVMRPRVRISRRLRVALGWHILDRDGATMVFHNGGTGGFRSFIALDPTTRAGVAALANDTRSVDRLGVTLLERVRVVGD